MIQESRQKLYWVDGLKGFGACIVAFVWHYQHFAPQAGSPFYSLLVPFYDHGGRMVEVFFMLSGLGMVLGYEDRIQKGRVAFGEYIRKRINKLFPLMWITLLIVLFLQCIYIIKAGVTFIYPNLDIYHFLLNLLGLQNGVLEVQWSYNSPTWYISVLLWCYITFYFIVDKTKENGSLLVFKYIVAALVGGVVILLGPNLPLFNALMGRGFSCFFLGAVLAKLYQQRDKFYTQRIGYCCFVFLMLVWILTRFFGYEVLGNIQMAIVLGIAPAMILCIQYVPWLNKLFSLKPMIYLGRLSYSIYLWHFPVQCIWKIIDIYLRLEINYSRRVIWLSYAASVLILSAVYEKWLADKVSKIGRLFVREKL